MNYISIIYIIKQPNGSIRWLHSASELILPGHRLATQIPKFQCFIRYVPLFHLCFWFVLCKSAVSCIFLGFFRCIGCALVSSDQSMLSKCDDVITYAKEPLNIQSRQMLYLSFTTLFKAFR